MLDSQKFEMKENENYILDLHIACKVISISNNYTKSYRRMGTPTQCNFN